MIRNIDSLKMRAVLFGECMLTVAISDPSNVHNTQCYSTSIVCFDLTE